MHKTPSPRWLLATLILVVLVLLAGGAWFYRSQQQALRQEAEQDLQAVAQLKVDQIATWRAERLADAYVIMASPFFLETVTRWLTNPQPEDIEQFLARFRSRQYEQYSDILLVDASGQVCLSLSDQHGSLQPTAAQAMATAFQQRQPVLTDLHAGPGDQPPHLGAIAPFFASSDDVSGTDRSVPIGAIILQCDARQFLYPLIQSWPTPSQTAETLLVHREGDKVLFLNDLRHEANTALALRFPLTRADLPAVMAVLGRQGIVEGVDYRGVKVLAALSAVPDSPWYMVAKVDKAEALTAWRTQSMLILALILGFVTAAAGAVGVVWQRQAKAHYHTLLQVETAHKESEARYRTTLLSVGDGVITTDVRGHVELLNPVAEMLTGWPQAEAHGRPLDEVFHIVHEETRQPVENPVQRVLHEGLVVGLANHTLLIARGGSEHPIADSGAPIRDDNGILSGVVLVFRDQTEERAALKALAESEEALTASYRFLQIAYQHTALSPLLQNFVKQIRDYTGCQAVGIRILDEQGNIPFFSHQGFSHPFYESENPLSIHVDKCMCINVITGKADTRLPFYTEGGSFYMNGTTRFLATVSEEDKGQTPNVCNQVGFESVALVPIHMDGRILGLIHVADPAENMVPLNKVRVLEQAGVQLGTAILRQRAEEEIRRLNAELEDRVHERTAQLEATNHELESFSYSVSHDLRAPLRAVDGYARILEEDYYDRLDDEGRRVLGVVRGEAQRMGHLIDDLLAFSRLGRQALHCVDTDMTSLARDVFAGLRRQAPERPIELRLADLPPANVDPVLLRQVWTNLLDNALKFSRNRSPAQIEVGGQVEGDEATYFVQDNGVGFDMQYAGKLFGVFQRLHTEDEFEGTGVGLALVQRIVHRHGGRVWAQAEVDRGARITFTLPHRKEEP